MNVLQWRPDWFPNGSVPDSPFLVFGISEEYPLDRDLLEKRYRQLSLLVHPDFADKCINREEVLKISARVNSAYRLLRSPFQTLLWLGSEKFGSDFNPSGVKPKPEFLMEMMEKQDEIAALDGSIQASLSIKNEILTVQSSLLSQMSEALKAQNCELMSLLVVEYNYYERLRINLEGKFA
ncbi:MAG: hypothetical protein H3C47_08895 [Candidatus Cloacimonetes bacterium]|nr:hypothetical protein [Candidatus Cloacimonadota bacterium]